MGSVNRQQLEQVVQAVLAERPRHVHAKGVGCESCARHVAEAVWPLMARAYGRKGEKWRSHGPMCELPNDHAGQCEPRPVEVWSGS